MPADSSTRSTVLIVDDTPENLTILGETLRPHYRVRAAISGERALHAVTIGTLPDVILLDVMMPDMDGYQVLQALQADAATRDIPVIFVTAMDSVEGETHGLALGAVDYITKPFNPDIVLARVRTHIELAKARERLHDENAWLEREVARRTNENALIRDLSLSALACLAEVRDIETGHHILRTQSFVELLAHHLAGHPDYRAALAGERLEIIVRSAPLHDIGKVGIPDSILLKPGRLTSAEFEIMKKHPVIGADAITRAMAQAANSRSGDGALPGGAFAFMETAREIALSHHEKWDGSGYPRRPARPADSRFRAPHGARRRLRRTELAARLQGTVGAGGRDPDHRRRTWPPLRPGHRGRIPGIAPRLRRGRTTLRRGLSGREPRP